MVLRSKVTVLRSRGCLQKSGVQWLAVPTIQLRPRLWNLAAWQWRIAFAELRYYVSWDGLSQHLAAARGHNNTFDLLFVQFYNTPQCSARRRARIRATCLATGLTPRFFTFDAWANFLAGSHSRNTRIYVGLPGGSDAAHPGFEVSVPETQSLAAVYFCRSVLGSVVIWEVTYASHSTVAGTTFYRGVEAALGTVATREG
ncbi:hypothetical protein F4780DRAFT_22021 [Xylariomycetidae sp. FL0641]|nr:hypothetical protein F4780DRAFT_22021 [Xylariomycetidae sp. FL0641]